MAGLRQAQGVRWPKPGRGHVADVTHPSPPVVSLAGTALTDGYQWRDASVAKNANGDWEATFQPASGAGITTPPAPLKLLCRHIGNADVVANDSQMATPRTYVVPAINREQANSSQVGGMWSLAMMHRGTGGAGGGQVRITGWSRGGKYRVRVNGQLVTLDSQAFASNLTNGVITIDFATSATRLVEVEMAYGVSPHSIGCGKGDALWAPVREASPRMMLIGDSYGTGTDSPSRGFRDLAHYLAARLGYDDVIVDALGGTGYSKSNASAVAQGDTPWQNFPDRLAAHIGPGKALPDVVFVCGSINDQGLGKATVKTQAAALFSALRTALPSAKMFAVTFGEKAAATAQIVNPSLGVKEAAQEASPPIPYLDLLPALTGTGRVGAEAGDGNRDQYVSTDNVHPSLAGHQFYGQQIADWAKGLGVL